MRDVEILDLLSNPDLLPQRLRHYGVFFGLVVDNRDPLKLGRLRIRLPHYYGMPTDSIPWATYVAGNSGTDGVGFYFVPPIGSQVAAEFEGGNTDYPVWLGGVPSAPGGVPETLAAKLDPGYPYGQQIAAVWDYTKLNYIKTPAGNTIILDDNRDESTQINVRRIILQTPFGNCLRIIESKTCVAGNNNAIIELGTVGDIQINSDLLRRLVLDNETEIITLAGPDSIGLREHIIEIDSANDHIQAITSRGYRLILDDQNEKIDLATTRPLSFDDGFRLRFDNPKKWFEFKSIYDKFGIVSKDIAQSGYIGIFTPYGGEDPTSRRGSIIIDNQFYGVDVPYIAVTASDDILGSNGLLVDSGFAGVRPQAVYLYGKGAQTTTLPDDFQDAVIIISDPKGTGHEQGDISIGRRTGTNTITLKPQVGIIQIVAQSQIIAQAATSISLSTPSLSVSAPLVDVSSSNIQLSAMQIMMRGPQVHDYFQHYHEISLANPLNFNKWYAEIVPSTVYVPITQGPQTAPNPLLFLTSSTPRPY